MSRLICSEDFYYLTDEEIAAYEAEGKTVDYQKLKEDRDNFHNTVKTGGACLLLLSSALYDELYSDSAFPDGRLFVDLSKLLSASGFALRAICGDTDGRAPRDDDERIFFVAECIK